MNLTVDLVVVALFLVVLVAVPGGVALLLVHLVCALGIGLAVEETLAGGTALVVLGIGVTGAPVVAVDLKKAVIGGTVGVFVSGPTVEATFVLGDAHHDGHLAAAESSVREVSSGVTLAGTKLRVSTCGVVEHGNGGGQ